MVAFVTDPFARYMGPDATQYLAGRAMFYLEPSNPRNLSIYERHGFETLDEIGIGDCPVITPMLRQAQQDASAIFR